MTRTAIEARAVFADIASSACDAEATPERLLACFEAADRAINDALSVKQGAPPTT